MGQMMSGIYRTTHTCLMLAAALMCLTECGEKTEKAENLVVTVSKVKPAHSEVPEGPQKEQPRPRSQPSEEPARKPAVGPAPSPAAMKSPKLAARTETSPGQPEAHTLKTEAPPPELSPPEVDRTGQVWIVFRSPTMDSPSGMGLATTPGGDVKTVLPLGTRVFIADAREKWRQVVVVDGSTRAEFGWLPRGSVKPEGALDLYLARLSEADHHNSKGRPLASPSGVIRQDRANYHRFGIADADDSPDSLFDDKKKRANLSVMLERSGLDTSALGRRIMEGAPLVEVVVWPNHVETTEVNLHRDGGDVDD